MPPWYHNTASHALPYGPLRPNVTSSIKPEVHNVSQRRQRRTESRTRGSAQILWRSVQWFQRYPHRQTDTHTHRQTNWSQYTAPLLRWSNYKCWTRSWSLFLGSQHAGDVVTNPYHQLIWFAGNNSTFIHKGNLGNILQQCAWFVFPYYTRFNFS